MGYQLEQWMNHVASACLPSFRPWQEERLKVTPKGDVGNDVAVFMAVSFCNAVKGKLTTAVI